MMMRWWWDDDDDEMMMMRWWWWWWWDDDDDYDEMMMMMMRWWWWWDDDDDDEMMMMMRWWWWWDDDEMMMMIIIITNFPAIDWFSYINAHSIHSTIEDNQEAEITISLLFLSFFLFLYGPTGCRGLLSPHSEFAPLFLGSSSWKDTYTARCLQFRCWAVSGDYGIVSRSAVELK